tara:strand:- start:870 stop:1382 length:513 start_codon:yes stop_codon:yes gene_type:complete
MATPTYIPLATLTLAASSSSVYFTEISQDYSDLVLVCETRNTQAENSYMVIRFNGDTGSNYSGVNMIGNASSAASRTYTATELYVNLDSRFSNSATRPGLSQISIFDYSASDKHKSVLVRSDVAEIATETMAHRWASTSAITSIGISMTNVGNFAAGSTFKLFGIHGEVV